MSKEELNKKISNCLNNHAWVEKMAAAIEIKVAEENKRKSKMWMLPVAAVTVIVMLPISITQRHKKVSKIAQLQNQKKRLRQEANLRMQNLKQNVRPRVNVNQVSQPNRFEYITKMIPVSLMR